MEKWRFLKKSNRSVQRFKFWGKADSWFILLWLWVWFSQTFSVLMWLTEKSPIRTVPCLNSRHNMEESVVLKPQMWGKHLHQAECWAASSQTDAQLLSSFLFCFFPHPPPLLTASSIRSVRKPWSSSREPRTMEGLNTDQEADTPPPPSTTTSSLALLSQKTGSKRSKMAEFPAQPQWNAF